MFFWILVAFLTAAVAAVLLLPLLRAPKGGSQDESHDAEVYRDQLEELKRDEAAGLIGAQEAELARAEVARRLLAVTAARKGEKATATGRRSMIAQAAIILLLPAIGLCLYLVGGRPDLPSQPLAARLASPGDDINILISKAEEHLAANPDDGAGWDLLAPIYYRHGRMPEAANAYREAIRTAGPSVERLDGHAEALIALSGGQVTGEARERLESSLALNDDNPRAKFYLALALEQQGKPDEAKAAYEALAAQSPADAPWLPLVNRHIAALSGDGQGTAPGNPTADDIAAAEQMTAGDRQAMIAGMVESLEGRLEENPENFEGWTRIIRSYVVLDQRDKARNALETALKTFPAGSENGRQLLALAQELSIQSEGNGQ